MGIWHLPAAAALSIALALFPVDSAGAQTGDKVAGPAIAETLVGNTFNGALADGNPVSVFAGADGSLQARFRNVLRAGEWQVRGDAFCARWAELAPDTWGCFNVLATGDGYAFQRMNGTIAARGNLVPGDTLGTTAE